MAFRASTERRRTARRALCRLALLATGVCLSNARADTPPPVLVTTADEIGQGFLMTRLDRCLAVTAAHVMKDRTRASLVGSDDDRPLDGDATLIAADRGSDVAVLDVSGPLSRHCGSDFILGASAQTLRGNAAAVLAHVPRSGKLGREALIVVDVRERDLIVAPAPGHDAALGGFSGSLITVDDRPAAMILSVVGAKGESRAIRYDRVVAMAREMADAHPRQPMAAPDPRTPPTGETANLASARAGARVLAWSPASTRPEYAAGNLVMPSGELPWEVAARTATIDLVLAGDRVASITTVSASTAHIVPGKLPASWEVLTSTDGQSWALAFSDAFSVTDDQAKAMFPPRRARYLRIRISAASASAQPLLSIGTLVVR